MSDILPEPKSYYGFAISQTSFGAGLYTSEDWRYIRSLGFNTIIPRFHWADEFEPDAESPYNYDESAISVWQSAVTKAQAEGLTVVLAGWLNMYDASDHPVGEQYWQGWATTDYVIYNKTYCNPNYGEDHYGLEPGLDRYIAFWKMIAQKFPTCHYCFLYYPFHAIGHSDADEAKYYDMMLLLIDAVRQYNNNPIWFVPVVQRPWMWYDARDSNPNNWHWDEIFEDYFDDFCELNREPIVWADGHAVYGGIIKDGGTWDYDTTDIDGYYNSLARIREVRPDNSICAVEYGGLKFSKTPPYTVHPSRLDALEYSNNWRKKLKAGYCYHWVSIASSHLSSADNLVIGTNPLELYPEILDILIGGIGF